MRKVLAIAAALGLIVSIYIFIASSYGLTLDKLGGRALLLHLGIFALAVPYAVVERMKTNGQQFSYGVAPYEGRPIRVKRSMGIFFAFFITFFLIFLIQGHAASPDVIDGDYVLNNYGTIVRHLSANEYFLMKASELRLFASGWMAVYYGLMMYLVVPKTKRRNSMDAGPLSAKPKQAPIVQTAQHISSTLICRRADISRWYAAVLS